MADTTALKNRIRAAIKANDNQEITGPVLQQALLDMVDELNGATETEATQRQSSDSVLQQAITTEKNRAEGVETQLNTIITGIKNNIDNGYVYAGIATPADTPVSGKVFYVAIQAGIYTNFGNTTVTQGINILKYNGSAWSQEQLIGIDDTPTAGSGNLVKSGGVYSNLKHEIIIDERVNAGSTQQIVRFGSLQSGEKVHIKVSNETGSWITHFYILYRTTDMTIVQQWSSAFEADIEIEDAAEYALYTNIAAGGNLSYDLYVEINGKSVDALYQAITTEKNRAEGVEAQLNTIITGIKNNIDNGYVYAGIATPAGTPVSGKVFYLAVTAGTYANFGGLVLVHGINILKYNGSAWSQEQLIGIDDTPTAGSGNLVKSGGVYSNLKHEIIIDERVNAGSTQQIVRFGELCSGEKVHIKVSNETGSWITHFYILYRTTDMTIVQQWSSAFEVDIEIEDTAEYALYTNIAAGGNLSYDAYIVINGNSVDELYQGVSENKSNIERLEAKTDYTVNTVHVEQTTPTQNVIPINNIYAGTKIRIKCNIVSGVPSGIWMFNFLSEYWTDENEHIFTIPNDGNYNFYTNINGAATVSNFIYNVKIERIGEAANDPTINSIESLVGIGSSEQYGDFNSSVQVDNILKFNSFKTSRKNANTQQINHIGVLPAGTIVRLVIYNYKVITGNGFFVHFISYNKNDGQGYVNLARLDYSGTIEVTLEEELDIYTISNAGPNTSVDYDLICQYGTALPTVSTKTYIAAWKDDVISEDSLLKSIHIYIPNSGEYTFGIGTVDWRPIAIISKTFNINLSAGDNVIDLIDRKIILRAGEKLFQYVNKNGDDGLCGYNIQASDQHFLFGEESGLLTQYAEKGLAFEAEYQSIDSVFALKEDVNTISDNVESNSETIQDISSSVNVVKDANGNNYELMVVNGAVTPILMQYSKALIMGNSLSLGMDYYNNPYGMLATKANLDYVSHILSALQSKVPASTVYKSVSSHYLESNLLETNFDTMFASIDTWDFDLIVYQGGENVQQSGYASYQQALTNLITYLKGKCPTAKFVITGVVLADIPVLEAAARNVAKNMGAKYVYCNGHTPDVIISVSNIWYNKIDNTYEPSDYIKQTHPNDLGFLNLANAILSAIGYRQIEKKHSINISSASVQYSSPKVGVEGGIVTIKTYGNAAPSISVTDMNNNVLQVTHYKLSDFSYDNRFADGTTDPATYSSTFDMPASDVTVVIQ